MTKFSDNIEAKSKRDQLKLSNSAQLNPTIKGRTVTVFLLGQMVQLNPLPPYLSGSWKLKRVGQPGWESAWLVDPFVRAGGGPGGRPVGPRRQPGRHGRPATRPAGWSPRAQPAGRPPRARPGGPPAETPTNLFQADLKLSIQLNFVCFFFKSNTSNTL